jgi:integrase
MSKSWNKNVDYVDAYRQISKSIKLSDNIVAKKLGVRTLKQLAYDCILLICLRNGARIGEAIEGFSLLKNKKREVEVKVEKRRASNIFRTIIFPDEVLKVQSLISNTPIEYKDKTSIYHYSMRTYKFNPHSLRYAFITYLSKQKHIQPQLIAKITKHARLDQILTYVQETEANKILDKLEEM